MPLPRSRTLVGLTRVACLLATLQLPLATVGLSAAGAHASEQVLDVGGDMLHLLGRHRRDPPRALMLNGVTLGFASGTSDAPLPAVIDGFALRCREVGPRLRRLLEPLGAAGRSLAAALPRSALDATARTETTTRAAVACLDTGGRALSLRELARRLERFARLGDLAAVGDLRFLYAETHGGRTTYVMLHTAGAVPLHVMFPDAGDAPGRDVPGLPRPAGSRRVLSAWQRDARPMLAVFATAGAPDAAAARYDAQLAREGGALTRGRDDHGTPWLIARLAAHSWLVTFTGDAEGTRVAVTPLQ